MTQQTWACAECGHENTSPDHICQELHPGDIIFLKGTPMTLHCYALPQPDGSVTEYHFDDCPHADTPDASHE